MVEVSCKVEVTGPVVAGSVGVVMVTLSSEPVRVVPFCLQVMEVRGRLKPEMFTDKVTVSPTITSNEAFWFTPSSTVGATVLIKPCQWLESYTYVVAIASIRNK